MNPGGDPALVAAVVARLDGLPLSIELAAGRLAVLPLAELSTRIERGPDGVLRDPARPLDRTTALSESIRWSVEPLPPPVADALQQLAVFAGPFDLDAARGVLDDPGVAEEAARVLIAWHLARSDGERLVLYDSVRDQVRTARPRPDALERYEAFFTARAAANRDPAVDQVARLRADLAEYDQILERARASAERRAIVRARGIVYSLQYVDCHRLTTTAYARSCRDWVDAAPPDEDAARLLVLLLSTLVLTDPERARAVTEELLAVSEAVGAVKPRVHALLLSSWYASERNDQETVRARFDAIVQVSRETGNPLYEAIANSYAINNIPGRHGAFREIEERLDVALRIAVEHLGIFNQLRIRRQRALLAIAEGKWAVARERAAQLDAPHLVLPFDDQVLTAFLRIAIEVGEHGGGAVDEVERWLGTLPPVANRGRAVLCQVLAAVARRLGRRTPVAMELARLPERDLEFASLVLTAARALDAGPSALPDPRFTDPDARAIQEAAELVMGVLAGSIAPRTARERSAGLWPPSPWLHPLLRIVEAAARERAERDGGWEVAVDGRWFCAPGGSRVQLTPLQARMLSALVADRDRRGLEVDALFAATWPGVRAQERTAANRVRVGIHSLRRRGFAAIGWERGRGWYLTAPVRAG